MATYQSLVGQQFGRLTVLEEFKKENGNYYCRCRCSCGKEKVASKISLKLGSTRSCGCLQREVASEWINEYQSRKKGAPVAPSEGEPKSTGQ